MHILVATDGSEPADRAIDFGANLAKQLSGDLIIVHVVSLRDIPLEQLDPYLHSGHITDPKAMTADSREKLAGARQRAEALDMGALHLESIMERQEGQVADAILEAAQRHGVELVVLGRRGLGRLSGLVLGSVSQKVVELGSCAVMVIP